MEGVRYGKYELLTVLGRGGMSDVFLALARGPAGFHKLVVIKELRPELSLDPEHLSMFFSEARLGARLSHRALVQVYDVCHEGGRPFIVMEYLDGQPLHRLLARLPDDAPLPIAAHLSIVAETLAALHHAHELVDFDGTSLRVVHRDVSPHNVFVTYDGQIKLVDFGIAKGLDSVIDTRTGVVKGKAAYMSPEQALGQPVDRRADVYAAGVMLWEALTGVRLWRGLPDATIAGRVLLGEIPKPRTVRPDVSPGLEAICMRALAHSRDHRFESAASFRLELLAAMREEGLADSVEPAARLLVTVFAEDRARLRELIAARIETRGAHLEAPAQPPTDARDSASHGVTPLGFGTATGKTDTAGLLSEPHTDVPTFRPPAMLHRKRTETRRLVVLAIAAAVGVAAVSLLVTRTAPQVAVASRPPPAPLPGALSRSMASRCGDAGKPLVELSGDIEHDATLTCDKDYLLRWNAFVRPGVTLVIEAGTTIKGDFDSKAALVVQPGGRLVAEGTRDQPVVFTSERKGDDRRPGDWGGVVLLGRAPTNLVATSGAHRIGNVEGLTARGEYGGDDEDDDSGVLRYVRIEYAGMEIAPGNELNGLTLAGVGRRTVIDHVQVRMVTDDCFEFFGGTVDARHLACQFPGDDGFDWDLGYRGRLQFLLLQQSPDAEDGSNGIEADNDPSGSRSEPSSAPSVYNVTLCGRGVVRSGAQSGILARRRTAGVVANAVVTGFDVGVVADGADPAFSVRSAAIFDPAPAAGLPALSGVHSVNPGLPGCPVPGEPILGPRESITQGAESPPRDGFFEADAHFLGALRDVRDDWATGTWTVWDER